MLFDLLEPEHSLERRAWETDQLQSSFRGLGRHIWRLHSLPLLLTGADERAFNSCLLTFRTGLQTIAFDLGDKAFSNAERCKSRSGDYPPFSFCTSRTCVSSADLPGIE